MKTRSPGDALADSSVVTFLFTDLVGSTELLSELGEDAADALRRDHFRLLRQAIGHHGGEEVKNLGDGVMAVFVSPLSAVACAVAIQQAADRYRRRQGIRLEIRIGVELGEPMRDDGDFFGTAVIVAKRLCDIGEGGQITVSPLVRGVLGSRGDFDFQSLGPVTLKGVPDAVTAWKVGWQRLQGEPVPPHPVVLAAQGSPFVGRDKELARLREAWETARAGRRQVVFLSGEPGIGKTRLSLELAMEALDVGGSVLYGRCDEENLISYQPFVQAIGHYVDVCPVEELRAQIGATAGHLARLVPNLTERLPEVTLPSPEGDGDRYWLFEAVSTLVRECSRGQPMLIIVDDLHWADKPTLLLLRHLIRSPHPSSLLLCGTYRESDLRRTAPLAEMLSDLRREAAFERIPLRGLDETGIQDLLEAMSDRELTHEGRAFAQLLLQETEGNPFFVHETVRHLFDTGRVRRHEGTFQLQMEPAEFGPPESVREVIGRRLSCLSPECSRMLAEASVLGREFDFEILSRIVSDGEDALMGLIDEALEAQLIEEVPDPSSATYTFTHAMVRQTLYEELSLVRRQRLHLKAAQAIEERAGTRAPNVTLAVHYRKAGSAAGVDKAVRYALLAGEEARQAFAWEDAADHWHGALELLEYHDADPGRRAELLERLADLMYLTGIDYAKSIAYLEQALALYEDLGEQERAAKIHSRLGRNLSTLPDSIDVRRALAHFEAAEKTLSGGGLRASLGYLYTGLSAVYIGSGEVEKGLAASKTAMEIGKRLDNPSVCANASLQQGWHLFAAGEVQEGVDLIDWGCEVANELDLPWVTFQGAGFASIIACSLADPRSGIAYAEKELSRTRAFQAPIQRRVLVEVLCHALIRAGELDEARRRAHEADGGFYALEAILAWTAGEWDRAAQCWRRRLERDTASGALWWQVFSAFSLSQITTLRHALNESEALLSRSLAASQKAGCLAPQVLWLRPELALVNLALARPDEATAHLDAACELVGDGRQWRGATGRTQLAQGALAASQKRWDEAESAFGTAAATFERYSLMWDQAECLILWGRALDRAGRRREAVQKLDAAAELYRGHHAGEPWLVLVDEERNAVG